MTEDKEKPKIFNGKLGSYKLIRTDDDSATLYSEYFDENCHSTSGALNETLYNYIEGCELETLFLEKENTTILEVGLGLGLGPQLTYDLHQKLNSKCETKFISTEIDEGLVEYCIENTNSPIFKNLTKVTKNNLVYYYSETNSFDFYILIGDARVSVEKAKEESILQNVDAIFQDPFSPKKNPILWTKQWFELLYLISSEDVVLSTYSSLMSVRKTMYKCGWKVFKREGFSVKRSMTIAKKKGVMAEDILRNIETSPDPILED